MSNLLDYLKWRGDISFSQDPFNSIDGMILSCLSYVKLEKVLPKKGKMTIAQASEKFFKIHSEAELAKDKSFIRFAPSMLKALSEATRGSRRVYATHMRSEGDRIIEAIDEVLDLVYVV